jgi:hypothetical protein
MELYMMSTILMGSLLAISSLAFLVFLVILVHHNQEGK